MKMNNITGPFLMNCDVIRRKNILEMALNQIKQKIRPKSLVDRLVLPRNRGYRSLSHFKKVESKLSQYRLQELYKSNLPIKKTKYQQCCKNNLVENQFRVKKSRFLTHYQKIDRKQKVNTQNNHLIFKFKPKQTTNPLQIPQFVKFYSTFLYKKQKKLTLS